MTISLPAEYEARMKVDPATFIPQGEYNRKLAPLAVAQYGGTLSRSNSLVMRLALDELWRRKDEPDPEICAPLLAGGLQMTIADCWHRNFSTFIEDAELLILFSRQINLFCSLHAHAHSLVSRTINPNANRTHVILETGDNGLIDITSSTEGVISQTRLLSEDTQDNESDSWFTIVAKRPSLNLPDFMLLTDTCLIECNGTYGNVDYAMVWSAGSGRYGRVFDLASDVIFDPDSTLFSQERGGYVATDTPH